ncbi:FKBP12 interacting protein 37 [Actinidia rufa]|uniref:FKBP12 interacting protein 37 n=1 Tax=Actinidia rufa TaxID=165716 RepID=A0A7J0H344_9ERIC|nr:FKBP12 interacting protein 37 [Actinidia rufa]
MASQLHLDDDDDFGGDFPGSHATRRSGTKRSFGDLEDDEDDIFGSKKGNVKAEETAPGVATGMILSLRESLQNCKDTLATCQMIITLTLKINLFYSMSYMELRSSLTELEAAKAEIRNWQSTFQNESFIPAGTSVEPKLVVSYLQSLKSSEESLREQLEKAKKKEAAFIVTFAKREQEIAELKSAVRDLRMQLKPPSMQTLVEEKDKKIKELQDNVAAVNFTPQSKMGKMLMAKCRTLQEENDEIGNQANEGKIHELGMKLALQKSQNAELRSQFEDIEWSKLRHTCSCRELAAENPLLETNLGQTLNGENQVASTVLHQNSDLLLQAACILEIVHVSRQTYFHLMNDISGFPLFFTSGKLLCMFGFWKPKLCNVMEGLTDDVEKSNEMVLVLQDCLEEKDAEITRLKHELKERNAKEEEETVVLSDKKDGDKEMIGGEAEIEI